MPLKLRDDVQKQAIASIRRYFAEELDQDVGDLKAQLVLEFFMKEIAPSIYNAAIADAHVFIHDRTTDLEDAMYQKEFAYWQPAQSVKRKRD
jgi:uncharacterized protein (DUF2164 family)